MSGGEALHGAPATVLVTGATSGIGQALAQRYARPGRTLILQGRDAGRLEAVAAECTARGATAIPFAADLLALDRYTAGLAAIASERPIDLAIVNAGISSADRGAGESWKDIERVIDVNIRAAMATAATVVPAMRARGRGQIAFVSSLAAWHGLPLTPAYCASKAALKAYAEALRPSLAAHGIAVSVVLPGFVKTPMSDAFPGTKPFMISAEEAAARIERGLAANRARIAFPQPLAFGAWLLAVLPAPLSQRLVRRLGF